MSKVTRRQLLAGTTALGGAYGLGLATPRLVSFVQEAPFRRAAQSVAPSKPTLTGLDIGAPVAKLVEAGVIDVEKFTTVLRRYGPVPEWVSRALEGKPAELVFSAQTASYNLNLLWPLGLATKAAFNDNSPIKGKDLSNYASTGGWFLGRENNGAAYFNAVETLSLTPEQSKRVLRLAEGVFRPCCNNSTFFQDCNHGSAMLGLLELTASNGWGAAEMLNLAKAANGFWYPQEYAEIALYFDVVEGRSWSEVPAKRVLSTEFSSAQGWQENVYAALVERGTIVKNLPGGGGGGCAV